MPAPRHAVEALEQLTRHAHIRNPNTSEM
jgi:hypothetical protein